MRSASRAKSSSVVAPLIGAAATAEAAILALAVNLQHALPRGEVAHCGDLLDQRLDVRAEEFRRLVARLANQVEMPRVPVGVLEPEAPLAEVDLPRDAGVDHPLQRAVDGRAADPLVLAPDQIDQVVGAEMPLLAQEDVDDAIALAGSLAAFRAEAREVDGGCAHGACLPDTGNDQRAC